VSIAGFDFSVRTDAKAKYVRELAAHVESQMEEAQASGKSMSTQNLVMMAAMSITDELFQLRAEQSKLKREVRERSLRILDTLEREAQS
jgi:cell division protein ZapA (FtsZ GTPase activity inhibitor)